MSESKKFIVDVFFTFFSSAISMFFSFGLTFLLARYLGANDLGLYRMASTIYGTAILFAVFGIPASIIKYVSEYKADRTKINSIVSSGILTSLLIGILFSFLLYFTSNLLENIFAIPRLAEILKIFLFAFPFSLVGNALIGLLNGLREMKEYGMATFVQSTLMIGISASLIYFGFGVKGAAIGVVLSSVGWFLYLLAITRKYFSFTLKEYTDSTKKMFVFGLQIFGANAINTLNYQADIIMIGYFLTTNELGYYDLAVNLSRFFWLIPQAIQTITYPAVSEYWVTNKHSDMQMMINSSMKYTACILLPIGLFLAFFTEQIIFLIFGEAFMKAVNPLRILLIGTIVFGIFKSVGSFLPSIGYPNLSMKINGIAALLNVILNFLLIPLFGISGAACATIISFMIVACYSIYLMIKIGKVHISFKRYLQVFAITIFTIFIFTQYSWINIYLVGLFLLLTYTSFIIVLIFTKEEKQIFMSLVYSTFFRRLD